MSVFLLLKIYRKSIFHSTLPSESIRIVNSSAIGSTGTQLTKFLKLLVLIIGVVTDIVINIVINFANKIGSFGILLKNTCLSQVQGAH